MFKNIFYGWWNVATGFVGMGLSYAIFTVFAFGTFVAPLQAEFGWGRGELSFAISMTNLAVVIVSPCIGLLIDRFGVRQILIPSTLLMAFSVGAVGLLTPHLWHLYVLYFLIPFLGAGTLPASYSKVLIAWFNLKRGLALGVSLSGFGVGAMLIPIVSQLSIDALGWRASYFFFCGAIIMLALPMAIFILKESPAALGLQADGIENDVAAKKHTELGLDHETGMTGSEAARTTSYWRILGSFLLVGVGLTGILAHLVPMLLDRGMDARVASSCMSSIGLGIIFGRILEGYLMDKFFAPYVTACFLLGMVLGISILASGTTTTLVFPAAILVGMASGAEISAIAYICSRYFGKKAFGQIYGVMFAAFQVGAIIGAPLMGFYHDKAGNYVAALWLLAAAIVIASLLIASLKPYPVLED